MDGSAVARGVDRCGPCWFGVLLALFASSIGACFSVDSLPRRCLASGAIQCVTTCLVLAIGARGALGSLASSSAGQPSGFRAFWGRVESSVLDTPLGKAALRRGSGLNYAFEELSLAGPELVGLALCFDPSSGEGKVVGLEADFDKLARNADDRGYPEICTCDAFGIGPGSSTQREIDGASLYARCEGGFSSPSRIKVQNLSCVPPPQTSRPLPSFIKKSLAVC